MPYLLLQSLLQTFLCLCKFAYTHWLDIKSVRHFLKERNSCLCIERARSPLCCRGNVMKDMPWNFVMSITTVQSFSSLHKMSSDIFHFLWFYVILCQSCDVTSHLICINKISSNSASKNTIKIKRTPFFIILKALPNKLIKISCPMHLQELRELIFGPPLAWRVLQVACARVYLAFSRNVS